MQTLDRYNLASSPGFPVIRLAYTRLYHLKHPNTLPSLCRGAFALVTMCAARLQVAHDVAAGLAYLHPLVVHRDLKPGNVLLDDGGRAKITDFGAPAARVCYLMFSTAVRRAHELYSPLSARVLVPRMPNTASFHNRPRIT